MLTLTVAEIKDLAECAGIALAKDVTYDADELETEIVVMVCPKEGVRNDDGNPDHYTHIAFFAEYPEEGTHPLGEKLTLAYNNLLRRTQLKKTLRNRLGRCRA